MRSSRLAVLLLFFSLVATALFSQTWTYTPRVYPVVCTNPATLGQWTMDYATATNRAATENKPVYVILMGSTWCPDCTSLENLVLDRPGFDSFMSASDAYWVWLDFPKRNATNATSYSWLCHTNTGLFTLEQSEALLARNRSLERYYGAIKNYTKHAGTTADPYRINYPTLLVLRPDGSYQGEVTHYRTWTNITETAFINKVNRIWNDDAWDVQDNGDPGKDDDSLSAATALTNITEAAELRQSHTLSPTDAADWYTFTALPGKTYHFKAEGRLLDGQLSWPAEELGVQLYTSSASNALPVMTASGTLEASPTLTWTLNQATPQTCYVKMGGAFAARAGYDLVVTETTDATPAGVRFAATVVTNDEAAASVTLKVSLTTPCLADGGVRVFFSTCAPASPVPCGTAAPNLDYLAVISNEVVWTREEAIAQVTKQVTVPLVQDLHSDWEGDEQLLVKLEDGLNSAVAAEGGQAAVVLKESTQRVPGRIGFTAHGDPAAAFANANRPAGIVREGNQLVLWLSRVGGSDGEVSARVETVGGTALPGIHFVPQATDVTWAHRDAAPKAVALMTLATADYEADKALSVRISSTTASGTILGAGSVAVTIRDQLVSQTLGESSPVPLKYTSSGSAAWFIGPSGEWRCAPVQPGKSTVLTSSVTGPGRLMFDWEFLSSVDPASRLVVRVGSEARTFLASDAQNGYAVFYVTRTGAQSVSWQVFADGAGSAAAALSTIVWQPLQKPTSPAPAPGFVCAASPALLAWAAVPGADEYRVYLGVTQNELVRQQPADTITDTSIEPCLECGLLSQATYYWRVDAVMNAPGGEVVVRGDVWNFGIKSYDGPVTELPPFTDTEGLQQEGSGAYRLVAGVNYELGPFAMFYNCGCGDSDTNLYPVVYSLAGSLPTGMTMKDIQGATHFVGLPSKTGNFALWVSSSAQIEGVKQVGSTLPLAFTVVPLQKASGQFSGWVTHAEDQRKNGGFALSVSEAGRLTAKVQVEGKSYSFTKNGYDSEADGTVAVRLTGQAFQTLTGEGFTNTLDLAISMSSGKGTGVLTLADAIKNGNGQTIGGAVSVRQVTLFRNSWADADKRALATACAGYYTVALPVVGATGTAPQGSGYVMLTVADTGAVRMSGALANGKTWSSSAALTDEQELIDLGAAGVQTNEIVRVLVYSATASYKGVGGVCGLLRFTRDETSGLLCVVNDPALPARWWDTDVKSVYGYDPLSAEQGFDVELAASGGFYDTVMNLQTWYLGRDVAFGAFGDASPAPAGYGGANDLTSTYLLVGGAPAGLDVLVGAQTLTVPKKGVVYEPDTSHGKIIDFGASVNPYGLTMLYRRATGLFSGSFTLYYQGQGLNGDVAYKTKLLSYKGVLTPVRRAEGPWAATEGQGFYLVPDKSSYLSTAGQPLSYSFNWSKRITLEAPAD